MAERELCLEFPGVRQHPIRVDLDVAEHQPRQQRIPLARPTDVCKDRRWTFLNDRDGREIWHLQLASCGGGILRGFPRRQSVGPVGLAGSVAADFCCRSDVPGNFGNVSEQSPAIRISRTMQCGRSPDTTCWRGDERRSVGRECSWIGHRDGRCHLVVLTDTNGR